MRISFNIVHPPKRSAWAGVAFRTGMFDSASPVWFGSDWQLVDYLPRLSAPSNPPTRPPWANREQAEARSEPSGNPSASWRPRLHRRTGTAGQADRRTPTLPAPASSGCRHLPRARSRRPRVGKDKVHLPASQQACSLILPLKLDMKVSLHPAFPRTFHPVCFGHSFPFGCDTDCTASQGFPFHLFLHPSLR